MMVKVGVNGFGHIWHLVTRAAFNAGKVDAVTIRDPFTDLCYRVYMFQYDSIHRKFNGIVKAENGETCHQWKAHLHLPGTRSHQHQKGDKAIGKVTPKPNGKLTGMAFHVPTPKRSDMDLTYCLDKGVKYDGIKKVDILGYTEDHVVSCNFNGDTHSSTFNAGAGIALSDHFIKFISCCNSEFGYSNHVVDLMVHTASKSPLDH
ncbi:glyceraldehyde-3-phosphate dehydrogenase [Lynx pardinus]|uniref:Glyceraldehyde-3-phosphate dehydrogenase n=1 Tax=Lynx pardinus TaxID=191816 RepID=A0A485NPZ1_LYNPA|nr:glyceraldehyde-3-phosphate dehydrogenase [Lynx pardinus]